MNPKSAKKTLLLSLILSAVLVTVAETRKGKPPEPKQYIGLGTAFFLAAILVETIPPLGAGLAILISVSLLLKHGSNAAEGLIGAQTAARRFAQPRASVVPSLNLTPSASGFLAAPSAKGKWGSAEAACKRITRRCAQAGLVVKSAKRAKLYITSGRISDHSYECKACYAQDWFGLKWQMDLAAQNIARDLGKSGYDGTTELNLTVTVDGYRIQVLYRTLVGGDHFGHIHVGARLASYDPGG